jgi:NADH-ubiquinone oxidoreductase chain 3
MSNIIFFICFTVLLAIALLCLNLFLGPHNPYGEKSDSFECGFSSFRGQNRAEFNISFFIFGLLFLLFDLEILLVYPYTVSSYNNSYYGLSLVLIFLLILTVGFVYEFGRGALVIRSKQTGYLADQTLSSSGKGLNGIKRSSLNLYNNQRKSYSTTSLNNKPSSAAPLQSNLEGAKVKEFIQWFVGLMDGEANFYIVPKKDNDTTYFSFKIRIGLHIDELPLLKLIQKRLGCGVIEIRKDNKSVTLIIGTHQDLINIIFPILENFTLNSTKHLDYLSFKNAFNLYINPSNNRTEDIINDKIQYLGAEYPWESLRLEILKKIWLPADYLLFGSSKEAQELFGVADFNISRSIERGRKLQKGEFGKFYILFRVGCFSRALKINSKQTGYLENSYTVTSTDSVKANRSVNFFNLSNRRSYSTSSQNNKSFVSDLLQVILIAPPKPHPFVTEILEAGGKDFITIILYGVVYNIPKAYLSIVKNLGIGFFLGVPVIENIWSFCHTGSATVSDLESELDGIIAELNRLLPQLATFISRFNQTIVGTGINIVTDALGNLGIDVLADMDDNTAQQIANRVELIDSLIRNHVSRIRELLTRAIEIERQISESNGDYVSKLTEIKRRFDSILEGGGYYNRTQS